METHLVLLEIAQEDLRVANLLLEKKMFPHSVFFLQQGVEKLLKSFGMWSKIITLAEAKGEIGHAGHKVHMKFVEYFYKLKIPDTAFPALEKMGWGKEYLEKMKSRANQARVLLSNYSPSKALSSSLSLSNPLSDMLVEIQREMQEMREDTLELQEQSERLSEKEVEEFREQLPQLLERMLPREVREVLKKTFEQITSDMMLVEIRGVLRESLSNYAIPRRELDFCLFSLLKLSLIFSAHEAATRYPDAGFNPLSAYVESTPLIRMLDPFIEVTREICMSLEDVYAKMKPLILG